MQQYHGDQADLLVRYMFTLTPQEQAALLGRTPNSQNSARSGSNLRRQASSQRRPCPPARRSGSLPLEFACDCALQTASR